MVSGLCDTLEQSAGTAFLLILNVHRLPPAFVENSKPIFLRIITTHSCHTHAHLYDNCARQNKTKGFKMVYHQAIISCQSSYEGETWRKTFGRKQRIRSFSPTSLLNLGRAANKAQCESYNQNKEKCRWLTVKARC